MTRIGYNDDNGVWRVFHDVFGHGLNDTSIGCDKGNPLKLLPTMAKPNTRPSMAMVSKATCPRQPLSDGLVDAAYEGFDSNTLHG